MEKNNKTRDLLHRRMTNKIRMGLSQRGRVWAEMKAVEHRVLESGRMVRLKIQF